MVSNVENWELHGLWSHRTYIPYSMIYGHTNFQVIPMDSLPCSFWELILFLVQKIILCTVKTGMQTSIYVK